MYGAHHSERTNTRSGLVISLTVGYDGAKRQWRFVYLSESSNTKEHHL